jgi:hypothetical protein
MLGFTQVYLSDRQAESLFPSMICAGTYSKFSKALLNIDPLLKGCERHADPGRRLLRGRVVESASLRPSFVPAPSDALALANRLLALRDTDVDEAERVLARAQYAAAVRELRVGVAASTREAEAAMAQLGLVGEELAAGCAACAPQPMAVAVECGRSQRHTRAVGCLLAMMFADAESACTLRAGSAGLKTGADRPVTHVLVFASHVRAVPVPSADLAAEERLGALLDRAVAQQGLDAERADYGAMLADLGRNPVWAGRDVIVCSDFSDSDRWAGAVRAWRSDTESGQEQAGRPGTERGGDGSVARAEQRLVSCWRMMNVQARGRRPAWDEARRRVDVVFCLDTTGSMGGCIEACKRQVARPRLPLRLERGPNRLWLTAGPQVRKVLAELRRRCEMPVRCAFVSYKDFGDGGDADSPSHIAEFGCAGDFLRCLSRWQTSGVKMTGVRWGWGCRWVPVDDADGMDRLEAFIARLRASGGGDAEDAAGGLAVVGQLFEALPEPSLRVCLLMADAPCHGMTEGGVGDSHKYHLGVEQAQRAREVVQEVLVRGGVELVVCNPGGNMSTSRMVQEFNRLLVPVNSHVDEASAP